MEPIRFSSIVILVVAAAAFRPASSCMTLTPPKTDTIDPVCPQVSLDAVQLRQVMVDGERVQNLTRNPHLLGDPVNQKPLVQLTAEQEEDLLRLNLGVFRQNTPRNSSVTERSRREVSSRTCPPQPIYTPVVLALTPGGDLVQLAQLSDHSQWVFNEGCLYTGIHTEFPEVNCNIIERSQLALFINLSEIHRHGGRNSNFILSYVVLRHCGGFWVV